MPNITIPATIMRKRADNLGHERLSFQEVEWISTNHNASFTREIEMLVDAATNHNAGLTMQFFQDARSPQYGYSGACNCLQDYAYNEFRAIAPAMPKFREDLNAILRRAMRCI